MTQCCTRHWRSMTGFLPCNAYSKDCIVNACEDFRTTTLIQSTIIRWHSIATTQALFWKPKAAKALRAGANVLETNRHGWNIQWTEIRTLRSARNFDIFAYHVIATEVEISRALIKEARGKVWNDSDQDHWRTTTKRLLSDFSTAMLLQLNTYSLERNCWMQSRSRF